MNNKKIIFQVTGTYMKENKKRTFITLLGILVMVVLMTAVFIGKDTALDFMTRAAISDSGSWHGSVYDLDASEVKDISGLDSIEQTEISRPLGYTDFPQSGKPEMTPMLELKGYSGDLFDWMNIKVTEGRLPENDQEIIISQRAIDDGADIKVGDTIEVDAYERYIHAFLTEEEEKKINSGSNPEDVGQIIFGNSLTVTHGDTVKVPAHFAYWPENSDFEEIHKSTGVKGTYTIVGIMEMPFYEESDQGGYAALTRTEGTASFLADAEKNTGTETTGSVRLTTDSTGQTTSTGTEAELVNLVFRLNLKSHDDYNARIYQILYNHMTPETKKALTDQGSSYQMPDGSYLPIDNSRFETNDILLAVSSRGKDDTFNLMMTFFQGFFIILIIAASLVLIYNVFAISFKERSRYLGMLSSVGATRSQKKWSVYYEVFVLLAMAIPFGIILGLLVVKGVMGLLYPHFSSLMNAISTNVIAGKSVDIGYKLVITPANILFIILFSALAVWVSAWIPALKISKIPPVESIRGNEFAEVSYSRKSRKHGKISSVNINNVHKQKVYKTCLGLMKKAQTTRLLSLVNVKRSRRTTRGIVRSIVAFLVLSLITVFASKAFLDLVKSKTLDDEAVLSSDLLDYDYAFMMSEDDLYEEGKKILADSGDVSSSFEIVMEYYACGIPADELTDEYKARLEEVVAASFPAGIPDEIRKTVLNASDPFSCQAGGFFVLPDTDFEKVAKNAVSENAGSLPRVLVMDNVNLTTDDYKFDGYKGVQSVKPDYKFNKVHNPLNLKSGDNLTLATTCYDEKTEETYNSSYNTIFAGYVSNDDLKDYVKYNSGTIWMVISASDYQEMKMQCPDSVMGMTNKIVLFNSDSKTLVSQMKSITDEWGNSGIFDPGAKLDMTSFFLAITKMIEIIAISFTLLITIISLLNLYNSVMGRALSRHQEMFVLAMNGMTRKQKNRMLLLENVRLLARAYLLSGLILVPFVLLMRSIMNQRFGHMNYSLPLWIIALTIGVSMLGLTIFTLISYRGHKSDAELVAQVRTEMV